MSRNWLYPSGTVRPRVLNGFEEEVRTVVVIDPEDREQIKRLTSLLGWALAPGDATELAAALREFADPKPPKPAEPTGLGAVVFALCECEPERKRFVRDDTGSEWPGHAWKAGCGHHKWTDLTVRDDDDILSGGVS